MKNWKIHITPFVDENSVSAIVDNEKWKRRFISNDTKTISLYDERPVIHSTDKNNF